MFRYDQDRDRFVPDRHQDAYSFSSVHDSNALNHQCVYCNGSVTTFMEPFQCKRQQEQRCRVFRQLQSYLSLEFGGYMLPRMPDETIELRIGAEVDSDLGWPIRMIRQRLFARKSNHNTKSLVADLLLDMPDLSNDWVTKILDWSSTGYVTAAIESSVHLWSERSQCIRYTLHAETPDKSAAAAGKTAVCCVKWDVQGEQLAYSYTVCRGTGQFDDPSSPTAGWYFRDPDGLFGHALDVSPPARNADRDESDESDESLTRHDDHDRDRDYDHDGDYAATAAATKKTNHVKVWLLKEQVNGFDHDQKPSSCGCITNGILDNHCQSCCSVVIMDWFANGQILVTGCTNGTVTFFRYDVLQKQLITVHVIHLGNADEQRLISCLQLSQDKASRHLAVATFSDRESVLQIWRFMDPPELDRDDRRRNNDSVQEVTVDRIVVLVDQYKSKRGGRSMWTIKALAWHPWKYSLVCYAVVSVVQPFLSLDGTKTHPSWFVLANACKGQVLKRVAQNTCDFCPLVRTLAVNTHSMTFSRLTGELLVSFTTVYRVQKNSDFNHSVVEKHSVVVMHALNRIVETMSSSSTDVGTFFAWNPDGSRIALSSSDESLKIWNFWPTSAVQKKSYCPPHHYYTNDTSPNTAARLARDNDLNSSPRGCQFNFQQGNHSLVSELSLDASRIIK